MFVGAGNKAGDMAARAGYPLQPMSSRALSGAKPLATHTSAVQAILAMLRDEDEGQQLAGLTELCEYLSISTEESLAMFPTEQAVPLLVRQAGHQQCHVKARTQSL